MRFALVNSSNVVVNVIDWDGASPWTAGPGLTMIPLEETEWCEPFCAYDAASNPRFIPRPE
jgi:hypothetical protein